MSRHKIAFTLALASCSLVACSESTDREGDGLTTGGETAGAATGMDTSQNPITGNTGGTNGGGTGGATAGANAGMPLDDGGMAGNGGSAGGPAPTLPAASGTCPEFTNGLVAFTVGAKTYNVQISIDTAAAASKDGPVVFYWHGTGSSPDEASRYGLGPVGVSSITAAGGIVAATKYEGGNQFPWIQDAADFYPLVDQVVACAEQKIGIDASHIHSAGMSAGGLFTSALSFARSNLLASVVVYSGGGMGQLADPNNKFSAMVFHGGPSDNVFGQDFEGSSDQYTSQLRGAGHFVLLCNHGGGHIIPPEGPTSAVPFFLANAYGITSPYATMAPSTVPSYCLK